MRFYLFGITLYFLLASCSIKQELPASKSLKDYALDSIPAIHTANRLRNGGDLIKSTNNFESILNETSDSLVREFSILNLALCKLVADDTLYFEGLYPSSQFQGLSHLVNGILLSRKNYSGIALLHRAKANLQKEGLENSYYYFLAIEQLGLAHRQKREYLDSADYYYKEALDRFKMSESLANNRIRILYRMAILSLVNRSEVNGIGNVEEALALAKDTSEIAKLMICKATLLRKLKRMEESDQVRKEAEVLVQNLNKPYLHFFLIREQSFYHFSLNDTVALKNDLESFRKLDGKVPSWKAHYARMLSYYYYFGNHPHEILQQREIALKGFLQERIPDSAIIFETFYVLTSGYTDIGELDKAQHYAYKDLVYHTSLHNTSYSFDRVIDPEIKGQKYNFVSYDVLGRILLKKYQHDRKQKHLLEAFTLYHLIDSLMLQQVRADEDESIIEFSRIAHEVYSSGIETCLQLFQINSEDKYFQQAHRFIERSRSLITYRDILQHDQSYFPEVPKDVRSAELEFKTKLSSLKRQNLKTKSKELQQLLTEQDDFLNIIQEKYPAYYQARYYPDILRAKEVLEASKRQGKTTLNYFITDEKLYVLRYDQKAEFKSFSLPKAFQDSIQSYRNLLSSPSVSSLSRFKKLSHFLYINLFHTFSNISPQLEIVTDGFLSYIPFETLISDTIGNYATLPYLIKKHSIQYRFSLNGSGENDIQKINRILGYAYTTEDARLPALKGAIKELKVLERTFPEAKLMTRAGSEANRQQFFKDIEQNLDLIHIGMHASSDELDRLKNRIYFYPSESLDTVYAYEIIPKFIKAKMVVLTSCESGHGKVLPGEGTFSLARAFVQTGVNTVISSLWSLPDSASPHLCKIFYEQIRNNYSPAKALQNAKVTYLKTADRFTASPFFWAGLVCYQHR